MKFIHQSRSFSSFSAKRRKFRPPYLLETVTIASRVFDVFPSFSSRRFVPFYGRRPVSF